MKIAVVGTGAMGSVYAGLLRAAGHEVWAIDIWRDHVGAIRSGGLRVSGASGDRTVNLSATTVAAEASVCDHVIIATKAMDVEAAAHDAAPLIGTETTVVTIQNGLGSADKVRRVLGDQPPVIGVVGGFGASIRGPGHAHHHGWHLVRFGEMEGAVTPRVEKLAEVWQGAGFTVKAYDDIGRMIWEKLICNACFSGTCAATWLTVGEVMANEDSWSVAQALAREAYAVAVAKGIDLDFDDPIAHVTQFGGGIPGSRPSLLLDHLAKQPAEIDAINGAVAAEGRRLGVPTPHTDVIVALLKVREAGFADASKVAAQ